MKLITFLYLSFFLSACVSAYLPAERGEPKNPRIFDEEKGSLSGTEKHMDRKERMVKEMEEGMRVLLGKTVQRFDDIRAKYQDDLDGIKPPIVFLAEDPDLGNLCSQEEAQYEAAVQEVTNRHLTEMDWLLDYVQPRIWEIAFEIVGSDDVGVSYDTRTGIRDIDEIAGATITLVRLRAGRDEFVDDAEYIKRKRIGLGRIFKNDIEGLGRLALYASDPLLKFHSADEDGLVYAAVFQSTSLDTDTPLEFRQIVRNRVTRGGATVFDSGFHWDKTVGNFDGKLSAREDCVPGYWATQPFLPRLDLECSQFDNLRDFYAVRDFKTAVINTETGEILDSVSWQYTWQISHHGVVSVNRGSQPRHDDKPGDFFSHVK